MVFSSAVFLLLFLPITLGIYYISPHKIKNTVILLASLIFYAWGEPVYIVIMLFSTVFDYTNGLLLERFEKKNADRKRRAVLIISVIVNIGLLCFFKYTNFAIDSLNSAFSIGIPAVNIKLPIGISFYTFQTLSYTIDVYRKKVNAQHNILNFGMYISMFPQLIAGPIVRYADIEEQIENREIDYDRTANGIYRFCRGLCKKVILANSFGYIWDFISPDVLHSSSLVAFIGAVSFMFQIYFDFSGYSDMAIGLGRMFGFEYKENFDYPYESKSITEFWRRWHISLGSWFREYVYIPLGGNRKGLPRQIVNLFIVWFLTGLWHGAGWNFIVWGLYFFVLLVVEKLFLGKVLEKLPSFISRLLCLFAVLISWIIFACDDLSSAVIYLKSFFGANGLISGSLFYIRSYWILLLLGAVFSTHFIKSAYLKVLSRLGERPQFAVNAVLSLTGYAISLILVINSSYNPFLYFRF